MPPKQSKQERLEKKRLAERLRLQKIKNDPELKAQLQEKERQKYLKKKEAGKIIPVGEMSLRQKKLARMKSRESSNRYNQKKKVNNHQDLEEIVNYSDMEDSEINSYNNDNSVSLIPPHSSNSFAIESSPPASPDSDITTSNNTQNVNEFISNDEQSASDSVSSTQQEPSNSSTIKQTPRNPASSIQQQNNTSFRNKRRCNNDDTATLAEAVGLLKHTLQYLSKEEDCYTSFGTHIAHELKKYDSRTFALVKHAINNIIFQADMGKLPSQYGCYTGAYSTDVTNSTSRQSNYNDTPSPAQTAPTYSTGTSKGSGG